MLCKYSFGCLFTCLMPVLSVVVYLHRVVVGEAVKHQAGRRSRFGLPALYGGCELAEFMIEIGSEVSKRQVGTIIIVVE